MPETGVHLLIQRKYKLAIDALTRESARDRQDDFLMGPACQLGVAILCQGEFEKAIAHFEQLKTKSCARVSLHYLYAGLGYWFLADAKHAHAQWIVGLDAEYSGYHGLDIPFMLYFASSLGQAVSSKGEVLSIIEKRSSKLFHGDRAHHIAQFLLCRTELDEFRAQMYSLKGKNLKARLALNEALVAFYASCKAANVGLATEASELMVKCYQVKGYDQIMPEVVVARIICAPK